MLSANVIAKVNHSDIEDRPVTMATRNFFILILLTALVAVIHGMDIRGRSEPTAEECMKPPMSKFGHECCRLPKERIWGDLRPSLNACFRKFRQDVKGMRQEMADDGPEKMTPEPFDPENTDDGRTPEPDNRGKRPGRKPFSERLKDLFSSVYNEIKNTINSIRKSVVMITDRFRRRGNDSCFMECVFEDQGFLTEKMLNKGALLERIQLTLGQNEQWRDATASAIETCYQKQMDTPSNNTCQSGSAELFECVFKQIFFNCPNWTQSEYCMALKEFYQKCPDGPPPEIPDNHSTSPVPPSAPEESTEVNPATEAGTQTE